MWHFHLQSTLAFRPVVMPSTVKGSSQSQMILSPQIMIITGFTLACQPPLSVPTSLVGLPMSRVKMVRHFQKWWFFLLCRNRKINVSERNFGIVGSLELGIVFSPHQQKWASELSFLAPLWGTGASTWQPYNWEKKRVECLCESWWYTQPTPGNSSVLDQQRIFG